jgi:eukaryotic-like serine/threonine-protein kinase
MTEREIFVTAYQEPDPDARREFLDRACGADLALRDRIEALLRRAEEAGSFLEPPEEGRSPPGP